MTGDDNDPSPGAEARADAPRSSPANEPASLLFRLDRWVDASPFHPRLLPFLAFVLMLLPVQASYEYDPRLYPFVLALQGAIAVVILWRYRRSTPEVNLRFHWSALPVGLLAAVAWLGLGIATMRLFALEPEVNNFFDDMRSYPAGEAWAWAALLVRLLVTAAIVPVLEELFFRSAVLRSVQHRQPTKMAVIQFLDDLPVIGEWTMRTELSKESDAYDRPLEKSFRSTPLGSLTVFAVVSNIVLWCLLSHLWRDWAGTVACGLLYIGLVWYTNRAGDRRMGLGPVIWAHGITNALLVAYTLQTGDWRFL